MSGTSQGQMEAVHNNHENAELLMKEAQERFEDVFPDLNWMEIFGKNYLH